MIQEIKMPSAGQTTDEATIVKVNVKVGDTVKRGDELLEAETDKAILPVESYAAGEVLAVLVKEGDASRQAQCWWLSASTGSSIRGARPRLKRRLPPQRPHPRPRRFPRAPEGPTWARRSKCPRRARLRMRPPSSR